MNPDLDIEAEDRKISEERNRTIYRRRSRRELEKNMTPSMLQAERDIALGWQIRVGHMGYGSTDHARVRGTISASDEQVDHPAVKALIAWLKDCPAGFTNITIDIACDAKLPSQAAELRAMTVREVTRHFYAGLCWYCKMMGWPALTKREFDKLSQQC
jgi:hypothetical protein